MLRLLTSDKIIRQASNRYKAFNQSKQKSLKESLENGRALLRNDDQMMAYLHHYGDMHKQKLQLAYSKLPSSLLRSKLSVIDWGCGQGLAPIILNEVLEKETGLTDVITDVTLIEPSKCCLHKAMGNIEWSIPKVLVSTLNKREENVIPGDICLQEDNVIHIMSNVVDMPEFSGDGIRRYLMENRNCHHTMVMVSPFYPEEGRGKRMDDFIDTLTGCEMIYSFQKHKEEWSKDYSCQIRIIELSPTKR